MARWLIVSSLVAIACASTCALAQAPWQSLQDQVTATIDKVSPAVVAIERYRGEQLGEPAVGRIQLGGNGLQANQLQVGPQPTFRNAAGLNASVALATGAGVVIDPRGLVLTQYLNVRVGDQHRIVTSDGRTFDATIKGADPRSGLAVLELAGASDLIAVPMSTAETVRKGTFVVALGNPQAIASQGSASASMGVVSNVGQKAPLAANFSNVADNSLSMVANTTLHQLGTLIETDAPLGWSVGGGALVDMQGELIGVITDAVTLPGYEAPAHYAIPVSKPFSEIIERLKRGEEVEYALLGVALSDPRALLAPAANQGATVTSTYGGTPAARAGLQPGDVIRAVDGHPLTSPHDLQLQVGTMSPGKTVTFDFVRQETLMTAKVVLAKYHVAGDKVVTAPQRDWRGMRVDFATALPMQQLVQSQSEGLIDDQGCVVVSAVLPESPSWASGVRPGMFVSHVGGTRVTTPDEFYAATASADETVDLKFTEPTPQAEPDFGGQLELPLPR